MGTNYVIHTTEWLWFRSWSWTKWHAGYEQDYNERELERATTLVTKPTYGGPSAEWIHNASTSKSTSDGI